MRVLIAVDEGRYSEAEIDFVGMHQFAPGTQFRLLHAVEPSDFADIMTTLYGQSELNEIMTQRIQQAERDVTDLRTKLAAKLPPEDVIDTLVVCAKAAEAIVGTAETWNADLIVLGSHGRRGLSRFLLGSTSVQVLTHAPCSVAVVRIPTKGKQRELPIHFAETDLPAHMVSYEAERCKAPTQSP